MERAGEAARRGKRASNICSTSLTSQARAIRAEFEANRDEVRFWLGDRWSVCARPSLLRCPPLTGHHLALQQDNREAADRLLAHGEQLLKDWKHPDPCVRE